jgi:hypothetical protein
LKRVSTSLDTNGLAVDEQGAPKTKCPEPCGPGTRVTIARQPPLNLDPRAFLTSQKKTGSNSPNLGFAFGLVERTLGKAPMLVTA